MFIRMMVSAAALLAATSAWAGEELILAPAANWVQAAEVGTPRSAEAPEVGYRYRLYDGQTRFEQGLLHTYVRYRILLTSPVGLTEGGVIALDWSADHEDLTVHHVRVIRQGQVIEVLNSQKFEILRRETSFESSMVMGFLTAALHPADLRVGDELDVAYTISRKEPVAGAMPEALVRASFALPVEHLKVRMSWPDDLNMQMRALPGWTVPNPKRRAGFQEVSIDLQDVEPYFVPSDAPRRFFRSREVELSSYQGWSDLVGLLAPSYDLAANPGENSPIQSEIDRIKSEHPTQQAQALAALRLVQDEVRYLAVLLGEGGWLPTSADEVWRLRQGDCKGKTVLLLALLRGLGIEADAALVSTTNGDGLLESLPRLHAFDHVVVRADLDGQVYWLDGTRSGDRGLELSAQAPFNHALVLKQGRTGLEAIPASPATVHMIERVEIVDASAGLFAPISISLKTIMRGDKGLQAAANFQAMGPVARQQAFDRMREELEKDRMKDSSVIAAYDDELAAYVLTISGQYDGLLQNGQILSSTLSFSPLGLSKRIGKNLPDLPHVVSYPSSAMGRMDYRLPSDGRFDVYGGHIDFESIGVRFRRALKGENNRFTGYTVVATEAYEVTHDRYEKARLTPDSRLTRPAMITVRGVYQPTDGDRAAWKVEEAQTDPEKRAESFERRIAELISLGLYDEARLAADKAIETTGDQSAVWSSRAGLRMTVGDFEGAEADLDQAETLDPANEMVPYGRTQLAIAKGDTRDAILAYTRLLRMEPKNTDILQERAYAYLGSGLGERALADIEAALRSAEDADKTGIKTSKVHLLGLMGRIEEAENLSLETVKEAPEEVAILSARIEWLLDQKRSAEAMALARELQNRDSSETFYAMQPMVEALATGGDTEAAASLASTHVATNPDHPLVQNEGCWALARAGAGLDQAETWCNSAREAQPLSGAIADSRGRLYLQQGRHQEALAEFDYALSRNAGMSAARYGRGLALIALGREEEGRADLDLAKRQDISSPSDYRAYAGVR